MEKVQAISEEEILAQDFAIETGSSDPDEIPPEHFNDESFLAARATLEYTNDIDERLGVQVVDEGVTVSRDVLATYKTLLYRSDSELLRWKQIALISLAGFAAIVLGWWLS